MKVRWGAFAVSLCLVAGCGWTGGDGRDRNPDNQPGYFRPATDSPHRVRGDVGSREPVFTLVNGADVVRVRVADLGGDAFEVSTPDGAKVVPAVSVNGAEVIAGLRDSGGAGPAVVDVVLDPSARWRVRLAGGAADEAVDLTGGPGGDVDFASGVARAAVTLPAGKGVQRVQLAGGASQLTVRLGSDAPVRVAVRGGAGSVTVDGRTQGGISAGSEWTPDGWASVADRYDVDATSGVGSLTVERA